MRGLDVANNYLGLKREAEARIAEARRLSHKPQGFAIGRSGKSAGRPGGKSADAAAGRAHVSRAAPAIGVETLRFERFAARWVRAAAVALKLEAEIFHFDADAQFVVLAAENYAFQRRDVAVVAAPGDDDMPVAGRLVVGRVEVHPAQVRQIHRKPGVGSVGTDQFGLAGRR